MADYDVIIIGGGPAGASAAIYTARAELRTLVIDKALTSGALGITSKIANYPGIPGEMNGAELVQRMREQAQSFGAEFIQAQVIGVDTSGEWKTVFAGLEQHRARVLIVATGALGRTPSLEGEERLLGRGVSYCATCDAAFFREREVAVVGSNVEAAEEALVLARFAHKVHFISPKRQLQLDPHVAGELADSPVVELHLGARARAVVGERRVEGLTLFHHGEERTLAVEGVFIYLQGGRPITDFLYDTAKAGEGGCLKVDHERQTSIPGVFAVGDVICGHVQQAVIAAADGAIAAIAADRLIRNRATARVDWA